MSWDLKLKVGKRILANMTKQASAPYDLNCLNPNKSNFYSLFSRFIFPILSNMKSRLLINRNTRLAARKTMNNMVHLKYNEIKAPSNER
jgi:hypothetical protein